MTSGGKTEHLHHSSHHNYHESISEAPTSKPHLQQVTTFKIREKRLCFLTKPCDSLAMKKENLHRDNPGYFSSEQNPKPSCILGLKDPSCTSR